MATHTLSLLVENVPGVLMRVASLFSRRGYNIDTLAVGPAERPELSRMTVVVTVENLPLEQVIKQCHKLINVLKVTELLAETSVARELMLMKVKASPEQRGQVREVVEIFRAHILDMNHETLTVECTGSPDKLEALVANLRPFGILELAQTGRVGLERAHSNGKEN